MIPQNGWRGGQVGVETTKRQAFLQQALCQVRDARGRVSASTMLWRRVDDVDSDAALCATRPAGHGKG